MEIETGSNAPTAEFLPLAENSWQSFFDSISRSLEGRDTEIEVVGLDLGDQIEAEWIPLSGLTFDPADETFYVYLEGGEMNLEHAIANPREILIRVTPMGLEQVVVLDGEGRRHLIRLRVPLQLPAQTG